MVTYQTECFVILLLREAVYSSKKSGNVLLQEVSGSLYVEKDVCNIYYDKLVY